MNISITIIGGGISGLAAAWELARNGVSVTVLEAKPDFGGRILTVQHKSLPIELGAEFVHGRSPLLIEAIGAAGLTTHRVSSRYEHFEDGAFKTVKLWDMVNKVIAKVDPRAPDVAFDQFLATQNLDARTSQLVTGFVEGFDAAYPDRISAHSLLRAHFSADQMDGDWQGRIDVGYMALVHFLAREIQARGGRLIKGATVREVRWKTGHVEVIASHERKTKNFISTGALVTLPLGIWKAHTVTFNPLLSEKQSVVRELEFGNVIKIGLVFRERWWPKDMGFVQAPGELIPTWWTDPRGPVLTGWAGGPKADLLSHVRNLEMLALEILSGIYGENPAVLRSQLVATYHHHWASDPCALGAYSYIPVNGLDLPKLLAAPIAETLFFAGEATVSDAQTGTVFGAFESGLRAAHEIAPLLTYRDTVHDSRKFTG
ncbi:MAG TPA: NAD(P)/FAD-dependent oxidoreductase [Verrucomicrobiae bacterium]|nr:NAD(P)/FAD-dependent oxidoreductase [Verrucomicrobiae bacterium]